MPSPMTASICQSDRRPGAAARRARISAANGGRRASADGRGHAAAWSAAARGRRTAADELLSRTRRRRGRTRAHERHQRRRGRPRRRSRSACRPAVAGSCAAGGPRRGRRSPRRAADEQHVGHRPLLAALGERPERDAHPHGVARRRRRGAPRRPARPRDGSSRARSGHAGMTRDHIWPTMLGSARPAAAAAAH